MRKDRLHQFCLCCFQRSCYRISLDQLRYFWPNHMRTQKLAGFLVKDSLDQSLIITHRNGLAVGQHRKASNADIMPGGKGCGLGQPD